jgi:biopolymer transport protein ExbD
VHPKNISYILVNEAGEILFDNNRIEMHNIASTIKEKVNMNPNLIISVKTDRKIKYDIYVDVLDRIKKSGARKISVAEPENY